MEAEHKRQDELKHQAETAKEAERKAKYELALEREEERKMVSRFYRMRRSSPLR
jgi:hypothetical protein